MHPRHTETHVPIYSHIHLYTYAKKNEEMVRVVAGAYSAACPGGMKRENPFCMELKYFGIKMILGK